MALDPMYHEGMRRLQDLRETRRLADRLEQVTARTAFSDEDRAFIERCPMFFIATADAAARPDCSYKGGLPGFVRVLDERTLAIPDYDGNGMYRSWGNVLVNPQVGLLFLDFERPKRLRVSGTAQVREDDPLRAQFPGSVFVVRVTATRIFPNCPRYIHRMQLTEYSAYAPRSDYTPPVPAWKTFDAFRDSLPARDRQDEKPD
jgi:predicted pyridoxine 5'-phosphate oxidase superfamily flavin-nucleotide-binding protein